MLRLHPSLTTLLFLLVHHTFAQRVNLGNPPVFNFPKQLTEAGTQTWDIDRDSNGIIWFANNNGLLEFDGIHRRIHPLKNHTIVRSVRAGDGGCIFVGGQDEFGFFAPDQQGNLHYISLLNQLPENLHFPGEIWDVEILPHQGVFFRADHQVFRFYEQRLTTLFPGPISLKFMGKWGNRLLVQDDTGQFWEFKDNRFQPLQTLPPFTNDIIAALLTWSADTLLVATIQKGIFFFNGTTFQPWHTADDPLLKSSRILSASMLPNGHTALGTALDGLVILDRQRRILQQLNKKNGLQNNTVLSLLAAPNGGVWLGLDNGLDYVELESPFSSFYPDGELQGACYAVQTFDNKIYFGTNTGLYVINWKPYYKPDERLRFLRVQHADGQVWSLNQLGNHLLTGHHEGAFQINNLQAQSLAPLKGVWRFLELSAGHVIAGHYNGLALFRKAAAGLQYQGLLKGFSESSRLLAADSAGNIWMAHPYRGVFNLNINTTEKTASAKFFGTESGLPSNSGNHLFQLEKTVAFATETGIMDFDAASGKFVQNKKFAQLFGKNTRVKYLCQDPAGHIWYELDNETGVLLVENDALEKKVSRLPVPELKSKLTGGFQCIYPIDKYNILVATEQGFLHFDLNKYLSQTTTPLYIVLHEVRLEPDSVLFAGYIPANNQEVQLAHRQNNLTFSYAVPDYPGGRPFIQYSYKLEGAGKPDWSSWSTETKVTFNHLPPGSYSFSVKARNQYGTESAELTYRFSILPPWYAGRTACLIYFLLVAGSLVWLWLRQRRRFEQEKQNLQHQHRVREAEHQELSKQSAEVISQLQQEKLETEIEHKTEELAALAMHLVQKNALLQSMRQALEKLRKKATDLPDMEKEITRIARMIETDAGLDTDWAHFSQNFDLVHSDFLKRLSEAYPSLSPSDYKLCAYLRLNLSSKEIATLMNISLRGVETGRYRLRKKLNLPTDINLTEFLIRF